MSTSPSTKSVPNCDSDASIRYGDVWLDGDGLKQTCPQTHANSVNCAKQLKLIKRLLLMRCSNTLGKVIYPLFVTGQTVQNKWSIMNEEKKR